MLDRNTPDTDAAGNYLSDFCAFAAAHDPDLMARRVALPDVSVTLDAVAVLRTWLQRYNDALQRRR